MFLTNTGPYATLPRGRARFMAFVQDTEAVKGVADAARLHTRATADDIASVMGKGNTQSGAQHPAAAGVNRDAAGAAGHPEPHGQAAGGAAAVVGAIKGAVQLLLQGDPARPAPTAVVAPGPGPTSQRVPVQLSGAGAPNASADRDGCAPEASPDRRPSRESPPDRGSEAASALVYAGSGKGRAATVSPPSAAATRITSQPEWHAASQGVRAGPVHRPVSTGLKGWLGTGTGGAGSSCWPEAAEGVVLGGPHTG
jgi:hypothetical protein